MCARVRTCVRVCVAHDADELAGDSSRETARQGRSQVSQNAPLGFGGREQGLAGRRLWGGNRGGDRARGRQGPGERGVGGGGSQGEGSGFAAVMEAGPDYFLKPCPLARGADGDGGGGGVAGTVGIEEAVSMCLAGDQTGPRGGILSSRRYTRARARAHTHTHTGILELEAGKHTVCKDDALFVFGELHVRGPAGGGGEWETGGDTVCCWWCKRQCPAWSPGCAECCWRVCGVCGGQDDTGTEGNGRHARGNRRRDDRERRRERGREREGCGGAVVCGRWLLTDKGGAGSFSRLVLEDWEGPTVMVMAGAWTFDQVTLRVVSTHMMLLCVGGEGEAVATGCTFDGMQLNEARTEGFGACADGAGDAQR